MTTAALYLRSSKDRSDVSIDAQRRALHATAIERGLVVVAEYADAVESGKDEDRPAFQRLLAALRDPARGWATVLALDTSRIARRRLIAMMFESDCTKRGVRVVYKSLPESDAATDMVLRSVLQAFDEYHSLVSRAKGLAGMAENVRQGWRAGGRAPRGYRLAYTATGAVRDGAPVTKSRLVLDEAVAPLVQAYLRLRAQGMPRGPALARAGAPWPPNSAHSIDWQALTYAGHTVWGVEAVDGPAGKPAGLKRRPRAEWLVQRATHEPLITDGEAEAILLQVERATLGRRNRAGSLLLASLLRAPGGGAWESDGCGHYRHVVRHHAGSGRRTERGRKISAAAVEAVVLELVMQMLRRPATVERLQQLMHAIAGGEGADVDGRSVAALDKRAATLARAITRTVDLAAGLQDPAPVLRRVQDLEHQRNQLLQQANQLRALKRRRDSAVGITADDVRALLQRLELELGQLRADPARCSELRTALAELIEGIELDPATAVARVHFAIRASAPTGVKVATPKEADILPIARWVDVATIPTRRRAA